MPQSESRLPRHWPCRRSKVSPRPQLLPSGGSLLRRPAALAAVLCPERAFGTLTARIPRRLLRRSRVCGWMTSVDGKDGQSGKIRHSAPAWPLSGRRGMPRHSAHRRREELGDLARFSLPYVWPEGEPGTEGKGSRSLSLPPRGQGRHPLRALLPQMDDRRLGRARLEAIPWHFSWLRCRPALLSAFQQLRDALFARVGSRAGRRLRSPSNASLRAFAALPPRAATGELARAIDRGVKALSFLLRTALFGLVPTFSSSPRDRHPARQSTRRASPASSSSPSRLCGLHGGHHQLAHRHRRELNRADNAFKRLGGGRADQLRGGQGLRQ